MTESFTNQLEVVLDHNAIHFMVHIPDVSVK